MNKKNISIKDIISYFEEKFPQIDFPNDYIYFLDSQLSGDNSLVRAGSDLLLRDFFEQQGAPASLYNKYLSENSTWYFKVNYHQLINLQPDELYTYILEQFGQLFRLQDIALDSEFSTGFNRHGITHLKNVAATSLNLLREFFIIPPTNHYPQNEAIIGAFLHDIGNLISRKYHGLYGIYLFTLVFENFNNSKPTLDSFLRVLEIVLFHEVEYGCQLPDISLLKPSALCVIIADKTDVNYKRVSTKSNVPESVQDLHVLINLLVSDSIVSRQKGENSCVRWIVNFRPKLDPSQSNYFSSLLKATGRVKFPGDWQKVYEEANIEYLFVFNTEFLRIYLSRLYYAISAAFALFPAVEKFELVVEDPERGISIKRVFTKENYLDKIFQLGKYYYRNEWNNSYLGSSISRKITQGNE